MKTREKKLAKFQKITTLVCTTSSSVFILRVLVTLPILMFFMICHLILPVLLTLNNYCSHIQVILPPDRLGVVYQTFTKLDMVYSDFIQENMITTKHGFSLNSGFTKI